MWSVSSWRDQLDKDFSISWGFSLPRSSVAREGALQPPYWHVEYGKYHIFNTLETDFRTGIENSPSLIGNCSYSQYLKMDKEIVPISKEDLFFGLHFNMDRKIVSTEFRQKNTPHCRFLATRLPQALMSPQLYESSNWAYIRDRWFNQSGKGLKPSLARLLRKCNPNMHAFKRVLNLNRKLGELKK